MNLLIQLPYIFFMSVLLTILGNTIVSRINYARETRASRKSFEKIANGKRKSMQTAENILREALSASYRPVPSFRLSVVMAMAVVAFILLQIATGA